MKHTLLLLVLALSGCTDYAEPLSADDLQVFEAGASPPETPAPPRFRLEAHPVLEGRDPAEPVDLWLSVPGTGPGQFVLTLVWEIVPPATFEGVKETDTGDRLLHVRSPAGFPEVFLRAAIERPEVKPLPPPASEIGPMPAQDWVAAARERGLQARLSLGLTVAGEETAQRAIPEVRVGDVWTPVDPATGRAGLPPETIRLGTSESRAQAGSQPLTLTTRYALFKE